MSDFLIPDLPGSALYWKGGETQQVTPSFSDTVMIPITEEWGPLGKDVGPVLYTSFPKYEEDFGTGDSPGRDAVLSAFNGTGMVSGGGAGGVYVYRMATSSAALATGTIQNTAGTPANALTLTAKYKGLAGNRIKWVIEDDPVSVSKDRLRLLRDGTQAETFSYDQTDIASLAAKVNGRSALVTAASLVTGVALAHNSAAGTALTGGNNGDTLDAAAWQAALDALEFADAGIFAPYNLPPSATAIRAQVAAWVQSMAAAMRPVRAVFGGAAGEDVDDAITDAALIQDPHIVRLGIGTYHDDLLGKDVGTAQLAPRAAGVLAARGQKASLTNAHFAGLHALTGISHDDLVLAKSNGVTALHRISSPTAELAVSEGVTTYLGDTADMPAILWSEPRIVGLFDFVLRHMVLWGNETVVGNVPVTDDTRADVRKEVGTLLRQLEADGLSEPGSGWVTVNKPNDPALRAALPYNFGFSPTMTAKYLIGVGRVL